MRVFAIAKIGNLFEVHEEVFRKLSRRLSGSQFREVLGDLRIVACRGEKRLACELKEGLTLQNAAAGREFLENSSVIVRRSDDRDILEVLGRGANHRRS